MTNALPKKRIFLSLGLLSAGVIAFELALIQVFSITQWYHFAYMVISVAMLGFGAGGTFLALFEKKLLARYDALFPSLLLLSGIGMAVVVGVSDLPFFRFDTYLLFSDFRQVGRLVLTYLLFFIPFFLAALALGLTFVRFVGQIGSLYFSDLFGSGLGGMLSLGLMWLFFPAQLPGMVAVLPVLAGLVAIRKEARTGVKLLALVSAAAVCLSIIFPPRLELSEFKNISKTLLLPDAKVEAEKNSPFGLAQVVSSPALRHAPGLSLNYQQTVPVRKAVFNNGDWVGAILPLTEPDSADILDYTTGALPFYLKKPGKVLVLNAGTGEMAGYALAKGADMVGLQEANPTILSFLQEGFAGESDSLLFHPDLKIHRLEARTFLYTDTNRYDLILLPVVSAFGGTSGLNAMQEQYIMTREAFREMWNKLTPDGMISISTWVDYPVRNPLKVLATLVETLETEGIENYSDYLVGIRSWGTITLLMKRSPLSEGEIRAVRTFCAEMQFDPFVLRGLQTQEREQYNRFQDTVFFSCVNAILSPEREAFYGSYSFNIRPATDNRPYFSQFIRWRHISDLTATFGAQGLPYLEIGYLIVVLTLVQILFIAMVLILLPLFRMGRGGRGKWQILAYFGGIGLGYMFVEIVLIQRFTLYFGNPIYATAAVVSCLLVSSGAGSYFSSRFAQWGYKTWMAPVLTIFFLLAMAVTINPILLGSIGWPVWAKVAMLLLLVLPPGFIMGMPFPTGIASMAENGGSAVPWAWGINGYFSVISTALATIIAVEFGFMWVMICAAVGYLGAAVSRL